MDIYERIYKDDGRLRLSPDNMILSVALKYKKDNPIMLTSDNGLQLKSKVLGITTISLRNFLKNNKYILQYFN